MACPPAQHATDGDDEGDNRVGEVREVLDPRCGAPEMKFPISLRADLSIEHEERWQKYYALQSDRDRSFEEGIWRRTQNPLNPSESDWRCLSDQRRRIVHYFHQYDLQRSTTGCNLNLRNVYVYYSLSLPEHELAPDLQRIRIGLVKGGWHRGIGPVAGERWSLGDLVCSLSYVERHAEDMRAERTLPSDYRTLDISIQTERFSVPETRLPWEVLAQGMRVKDTRENPTYVSDLSSLSTLRPFHVELGCGASIEAGVPALHHLHKTYCVTDMSTGKFVFGGPKDDLIERLLLRPQSEFAALGELFGAAFTASPTPAHRALLALQDSGHLVGPVMTNNFDGLAHRVGLQEHFLRRYDEKIPEVEFSPLARSLLVIGSHADRRRVQARARARGLQIVYLDPEGYSVDGRFLHYPLEGPRDGDLVCRQTASEGLMGLCSLLGVRLQ